MYPSVATQSYKTFKRLSPKMLLHFSFVKQTHTDYFLLLLCVLILLQLYRGSRLLSPGIVDVLLSSFFAHKKAPRLLITNSLLAQQVPEEESNRQTGEEIHREKTKSGVTRLISGRRLKVSVI